MFQHLKKFLDNGREILSMCHVLRYLIDSSEPLINEKELPNVQKAHDEDWQETVKDLKGRISKSSYFVIINIILKLFENFQVRLLLNHL